VIGGPNRPNRPNWPDRPSGGDNININVNRPGWGWHPPRHPWYHGPWNSHWGNNWWYRPPAFFVGWGLGSWAYTGPFFNPYYVQSSAPFDYSQPVVINNFVTAEASAEANATAENQAGMKLFDSGMAAFQAGQFAESLSKFDDALKLMPGDPVLHEMRAMALFAVGKFQQGAAALNSLLASTPGMDWTTLVSLYGNLDDYTTQLRALESHVNAYLNDAAATFVLAYHYLVMGHNEQAIEMLRRVVRLQPKDATSQRLLKMLEGPPDTTSAAIAATENPPETDLVGRWLARAGDANIDLTIEDDSQFVWKATPTGKPPVELRGNLITTNEFLILDTDSQGSMVGQVKSSGLDRFQFTLAGGPPGDSGLSFERQK